MLWALPVFLHHFSVSNHLQPQRHQHHQPTFTCTAVLMINLLTAASELPTTSAGTNFLSADLGVSAPTSNQKKTQRLQNLHESMMPKRCQARSTCYNKTIVKVSNSELFSDSDLRLATILPKHVGHFWEKQSSVIRRFPKDAPSELPGRVPDLP